MKKPLFGKFFISYLLIILILVVINFFFSSNILKQFYLDNLKSDLLARAVLITEHPLLSLPNLNEFCRNLDKKTGMRITIILPAGKVLADSQENPELMMNHSRRPEIKAALSGKAAHAIRFSNTLHKQMMYLAVPINQNRSVAGVLRVAVPVTRIDSVLENIYAKIIIEGLIVAFIAIFISLLLSEQISRPLGDLVQGAGEFARGNLKYRIPEPKNSEISEPAIAMNAMALQLEGKINQITQQTNELEVILSSLAEGVIAININEEIIKLNKSAAILVESDSAIAQNQNIHDVIKNEKLNSFITKALSIHQNIQDLITLSTRSGEYIIQAYSTPLKDNSGLNIGVLIVLNDVTQLKRLENIRRDFTANVSHELKTPVTSIKGYAETLLEEQLENKDSAQRFITIILNQVNRLSSIIDDLLSLSRLEQDSEKNEILTEESKITDIIDSAMELCTLKAEMASVKLECICHENLVARINPSLMEQAIVNLIDNAIKYSPPESSVKVEAFTENDEIVIRVVDNGCGIPEEHLTRLFERFYRVDKARSRKLGGTGLGLSIVKHICQVHGGYPNVQSTVGSGSVFSIRLPAKSIVK